MCSPSFAKINQKQIMFNSILLTNVKHFVSLQTLTTWVVLSTKLCETTSKMNVHVATQSSALPRFDKISHVQIKLQGRHTCGNEINFFLYSSSLQLTCIN